METLLINYDRGENVISNSKCSSSGSTLIPEPLIGVGSSTSVNLVSGSTTTTTTAINNLNNNNSTNNLQQQQQQKPNLTNSSNQEVITSLSSNCLDSNGYKLLEKSASLTLEPPPSPSNGSSSLSTTTTINKYKDDNDDDDDDNQQCAIITSESSSSSSSTSIKSYINTNTLTRNTNNGLNSSRGCFSATSTPIKSITFGQLSNNYPNNLLSSCPSVRLSSSSPPPPSSSSSFIPTTTTENQIDLVNSYSPSLISEHLSAISSSSASSYLSDHNDNDTDNGPKSLPAYPSSTLSSPTTSTSSYSSSFRMSKGGGTGGDRESLYSGSGSIDDGLLTQNGSIVWDRESDWILLFDEMLKLKGTNRQGSEDCICRRKYSDSLRIKASQGITSSPSQSVSSTISSLSSYNDTDNMNSSKSSPLKRAASLPPSRRGVSPNIRMTSQSISHCPGAADEEMFIKSFEDVPMVHFGSIKELEDELSRIRDWLGEKNSDWTKRIDGLKRLRSILMTGSTGTKEFLDWFRGLELAFIPCVKDLRSQVVRETCFTLAYVSQKLGLKATRFCEMLLPILISLIPNSAKIMSSSATVAIRFIIQYTRSPRLIPIIAYNMNSKSREIRKACCEFLDQILHTWSTSCLEKHGITLQEAIKKGISDADPEARQFARKAFWGFADHFRESADALLQSLDPSKQRILHGEAFAQQSTISSSSNLNNNNKTSGRGSTGSLSQPGEGLTIGSSVNSKLSSSFLLPSSLATPSIRKVSTGSVSSSSSLNFSNHTKVPVTTTTNKSSTHNSPAEITSRPLPSSSSASGNNQYHNQQPTSYLPRIRCTLKKYPASTSLSSSPSSSTSSSSSSPGSYLNCGSALRSTSAIDADAARRARTRAAAISSTIKPRFNSLANGSNDNARKKVLSSTALVTNKSRDAGRFVSPTPADSRQRFPIRSSQSQPSSRSASPLSRSLVNGSSVPPSPSKTSESESLRSSLRIRRNSGIPVSTNSRETSPSRNVKLPPNGLSTSFTNGNTNHHNNNKYLGHPNGHYQFNRSLSSDSYNLTDKLLKSSQQAEVTMSNAIKNLNNAHRSRFTNNNHDDGHSDAESDTSSVCSDLSFAARNIEEVSDIICNLSSSQWMDRKEGLLDLNLFLQLGSRSLNQFELKRITDIFNKMLMDPHIKNYSLLLKVLNNLITSHKNHLYNWLYLLMTRLFIKMGSTTLASLSNKINTTLDTIFITFPVDNQFGCLSRFLSDQSQTLNEKSKLCLLSYFNRLIGKMVPVDCYSPDKHDLQLSLMKIISWTNDPKSSELRRLSKEALLNLFTLNRQRIYTIVYQLPKTYQDAAFTLIHSRKRPSDDKSLFTSSAVLAPSASLLQDSSMFMSLNIRNGSTFESTFESTFDDNDDVDKPDNNLNPDEIYHSLLRTTDEIQKYKFTGEDDDLIDDRLTSSLIYNRKSSSLASAPSSSPSSPSSSSSKAPSTSSASSSSTKLTTNNNNINNLPHHHVVVASPNLLTNGSKSKSTLSSSFKSNEFKSEITTDKRFSSNNNNLINGHHRQPFNNNNNNNNNNNLPESKKFLKNRLSSLTTPLTVDTKAHHHHSTPIVLRSEDTSFNRGNQSSFSITNGHLHHHHHHSNGHSIPSTKTTGHETVTSNLISSLKNGHSKDNDYQKYALNELIELIKDSQLDLSRHFRDMLKILLDKLADEGNPTVRQLALRILRELLLKQPALFSDYTELTVLRILSASKDQDKEVQRISDLVSATAATVLPADSCLKILKSAMNSGDGAISQAAIKMLSKFIERQNEDQIETLLPDIMPSLIQACDNRESSIRKSAIFTLVAIHNRIGDRLNPHIANLNGSKMKLLKLYIERAQANGSNGTEFSFS